MRVRADAISSAVESSSPDSFWVLAKLSTRLSTSATVSLGFSTFFAEGLELGADSVDFFDIA